MGTKHTARFAADRVEAALTDKPARQAGGTRRQGRSGPHRVGEFHPRGPRPLECPTADQPAGRVLSSRRPNETRLTVHLRIRMVRY